MPGPRPRRSWTRRALIALLLTLVAIFGGAALAWWKLLLPGEQAFANDDARFKYGSLNGELLAGIPYPIFMILPRVFPDLVEKHATAGWGPDKPRHGGYGAFGFAWEPGERLPIGFSIRQLGFERVTVNCALCHTTRYRLTPDDQPRFALGGPAHTADMQGFLGFLFDAARDRRFTTTRLMPEIALQFDLGWTDWALYSFVLVPATRLALRLGADQMAWTKTRPAWGPGRDDAFNLPKFVLTQAKWDDSVGNTDFPALWRMGQRNGHLMHWGAEARSVAAVVASSALGTGALPFGDFEERNRWMEAFMREMAPPAWPFPLDAGLVARGRQVFAGACAACHDPRGPRAGTAIPLSEIGTDPEHVKTWTQADADRMNRLTRFLGIENATMQAAQGYVARPLVGVWLLAPYLHNGSVPTLADLLAPPAERPAVFHRGYEVIDRERVGFVSSEREAERRGFRFDTALRGNGKDGHLYGTALPPEDKRALIEYLKTL
ncbi:MAG: hypothetical protein JNK67_12100 [Alphaproteobacteria bacterium]|nr:hypothetical protein [Alphaproteobacteria bacterium]